MNDMKCFFNIIAEYGSKHNISIKSCMNRKNSKKVKKRVVNKKRILVQKNNKPKCYRAVLHDKTAQQQYILQVCL